MQISISIGRLESALAPFSPLAAAFDPIFRIGTSLIFIVGGLGHFGRKLEMFALITFEVLQTNVAPNATSGENLTLGARV